MVLEVGRELGIADHEVARRVEKARAIDHPVRRVVQLPGHHEYGFRGASEPVPDLRRKAREHAQPERNVGDRRRRKARVDAVRDLDVDGRHHKA